MKKKMKYDGSSETNKQKIRNFPCSARSLLELPPALLARFVEDITMFTRSCNTNFVSLKSNLPKMCTVLNEPEFTSLYLLRGESLYHSFTKPCSNSQEKDLEPHMQNFDLSYKGVRGPEVLAIKGLEDRDWPMAIIFVDKDSMFVYNTIIGDKDYVVYKMPQCIERQQIVVPLYVEEAPEGLVKLGAWSIFGSNLFYGKYEPPKERQCERESLRTLTLQLIASLSSSISRIIQAKQDFLTTLPNRGACVAELRAAIELFRKNKIENACICLMDVDNFKAVNDQYGYEDGDAVLKTIASVTQGSIRSSVRPSQDTKQPPDFLGRYGGEEFFLIIYASMDIAKEVIERIRKRIENVQFAVRGGEPLKLTCSFGSVGLKQIASETNIVDAVIDAATNAIHVAKNGGKNRVVIFNAKTENQ